MHDDQDTHAPHLKLSETSRLCGIPVSALRLLIDDNQLPGVERSSRGHTYFRPDAVPTWHAVIGLLEEALRRHLRAAENALSRVEREVEAARNDITMALEDPHLPLGDDLTALNLGRSERSPLSAALSRLEMAAWRARRYHEELTEARRVV